MIANEYGVSCGGQNGLKLIVTIVPQFGKYIKISLLCPLIVNIFIKLLLTKPGTINILGPTETGQSLRGEMTYRDLSEQCICSNGSFPIKHKQSSMAS